MFGSGHTEFYKAVNHNLRSETKPLVDGIEGRKSLELVNALYESVETGKIVNLGSYSSKNKLGLIWKERAIACETIISITKYD